MTRNPAGYWRQNLRLIAALLALWFGVTFGVAWFARELSFEFFGWPFSFWVASQGAIFVFGLIVVVYNRRMDRLDESLGVVPGSSDRD
jgi:putative solute:sodium symporter small subunit